MAPQKLHTDNAQDVSPVASLARPTASMASMSDMSPSNMPNMFQIGNDLTSLFDALGHQFDEQQPSGTAPNWMTEELNLLQNGEEVSSLERLL
jgi:hypothetical protein